MKWILVPTQISTVSEVRVTRFFCGGGVGEEGVSVVKVGFLDSELCQNDQGISSLSEFFFWTNCLFTDKFYLHHQGETRILLNFWLWFLYCFVRERMSLHPQKQRKEGGSLI